MGAAGLTSSSVEMAAKGDEAGAGGFDLDLDKVPQREENMTAYEMMLSESQERMLMVLRPGCEDEARAIFDKWGVEFAIIGITTDTGRLRIDHGGVRVADLPVRPLADDAPNYDRPYEIPASPPALEDPVIAIAEWQAEIKLADKSADGEPVDRQVFVSTLIDEHFGDVDKVAWSQNQQDLSLYAVMTLDGDNAHPDIKTGLGAALDNLEQTGIVASSAIQSNVETVNLAETPGVQPLLEALTTLMSGPDLCSRAFIWQQYDHTVMGDSISKPGGDAAIIRVHGSKRGLAVTTDVTPRYVKADPKMGGAQAVVETWRNICATGAAPLAITNCLNFGNPERPEIMGQFVGAIEGMVEACEALNYPVISGNVSLYNETSGTAIPPTPAIGGVGVISDVAKSITMSGAEAGDELIILGVTRGHLGQSLYLRDLFGLEVGPPPPVDLGAERVVGELVRKLIDERLATACHDVADGGLLVAAAEMALGCGEGLELNTPVKARRAAFWFGEDQARYLIAAAPGAADTLLLKAAMAGVQSSRIGRFGGRDIRLDPHRDETAKPAKPVFTPETLSLQALHDIWSHALTGAISGDETVATSKKESRSMPMAADDIRTMIAEALPDAQIEIEDLAGDGDHYRARIVSAAFTGKSRIQQHQLVYRALKGKMGGELHALALETSAPD